MNDALPVTRLAELATYVLVSTADERVAWVSPAVERFVGQSCLGRPVHELVQVSAASELPLARLRSPVSGLEIVGGWWFSSAEGTGLFLGGAIRDPSQSATSHDVDLLHTEAIERQRAVDALAWEASVNHALAQLAVTLISTASIEEITEQVLSHGRRLTGSAAGVAAFIEPHSNSLCSTMPSGNLPLTTAVLKGLWDELRKRRSPLLTNSCKEQCAWSTVGDTAAAERLLGVPALLSDQLVGMLAWFNAPRDYSEREAELAKRLADMYAAALGRWRAETELKWLAETLELRVTERTTALETQAKRLQDSEARTRGLIEAAADAIVTINEEGTIESANQAAARMFGYAPAELIGQEVRLLVADESHGPEQPRIGESGVTEVLGRRSNGEIFPLALSVSGARVADGRLYIGIIRDVTSQRTAEAEHRTAKASAAAAESMCSQMLVRLRRSVLPAVSAIKLAADTPTKNGQAAVVGDALSEIQRAATKLLAEINELLESRPIRPESD